MLTRQDQQADSSPVSLTGRVTRSFGSHVLQVGSSTSAPVLVVFPDPQSFPVGTLLEVQGRTRPFVAAALEVELGVDLGPEVEGLTGTCVIVTSVRPSDGGG